MKILFIARPHIGLGKGGLHRKIRLIAACLRNRGLEVVFFDPWRDQLDDVDICHCFSTNSQMYFHVVEAKRRGKPVVMSPVFAPFDVPLWQVVAKVRLSAFVPGLYTDFVLLNRIFNACDRILPLHEEEAHRIVKAFRVPRERITIMPNGTERKFANGDPTLFQDRHGISDYVLQVSSIDTNKNQLTVIKAMAGLPYQYAIVGEPLLGRKEYMEKCQAAAGENVVFAGHLHYDDPMLVSAFAGARVFVLPSHSEVMPQALYQAAQAGCAVIASQNIPISPVIREYVQLANPKRVGQFRRLIERAMIVDPDKELRKAALTMPTWQDVSDEIVGIYEELMH